MTIKIKTNYVYQITHIISNKKYIGVRTTSNDDLYNDLIKYKSSSSNKTFIHDQKQNPKDYLYEILSIHETREMAENEEARLHLLYDVKNNDQFYNICNSKGSGFNTVGLILVKHNGSVFLVQVDDPKYISGEYKHVSCGLVPVLDKDGNSFHVSIDDPKYISGEYKHNMTGMALYRDKNNIIHVLKTDDENIKLLELTHINKDKCIMRDKDGNIFSVKTDDERITNGELVSINKGHKVIINELGQTMQVDVGVDLDGFSSINKNYAIMKDTDGNIVRLHINSDEIKSGMYVGHTKGFKHSKESKNKMSISRQGHKNGNSKKIYVLGEIYDCAKYVCEKFNISASLVSKRCKSNDEKYNEWYYL
jgi:hypothetical protein